VARYCRAKSMKDCNQDPDQTDEEILRDEVSDEAIEAASVAPRGLPTLMHNTASVKPRRLPYCFACPSIIRSKVTQQRWGARDRGRILRSCRSCWGSRKLNVTGASNQRLCWNGIAGLVGIQFRWLLTENCTTHGCIPSSGNGEPADTAAQLNGVIGSRRARVCNNARTASEPIKTEGEKS
jgi:hypothetical protein